MTTATSTAPTTSALFRRQSDRLRRGAASIIGGRASARVAIVAIAKPAPLVRGDHDSETRGSTNEYAMSVSR